MKRLLLCLIILLLLPATTRAQTTNRAGLVLLHGDGSVQTYCVAFVEDSISSVELLQRAKLPLITQPSGNNVAVCKIGNDGCDFPAEGCFCRFGDGQRGEYWAFWQLSGTTWNYSPLGAGVARVHNGDVNGWAWGSGQEGSGVQPPVRTFEQLCEQPSAVSRQPSAMSSTKASMSAQVPQAQAQSSASPANLATLHSPTPNPQPPTPSLQPATSSPQPLTYALFGALLVGVLGMIVLVLRRGAR